MRHFLLFSLFLLCLTGCGTGSTPAPAGSPKTDAPPPQSVTLTATPMELPGKTPDVSPAPAAPSTVLDGPMIPTPEGLMQASMQRMSELTKVLKTISSEATAKAAAPEVDRLVNAMQEINKQYAELKLSDEAESALFEKIKVELKACVSHLDLEKKRIRTELPAAWLVLKPIFYRIFNRA